MLTFVFLLVFLSCLMLSRACRVMERIERRSMFRNLKFAHAHTCDEQCELNNVHTCAAECELSNAQRHCYNRMHWQTNREHLRRMCILFFAGAVVELALGLQPPETILVSLCLLSLSFIYAAHAWDKDTLAQERTMQERSEQEEVEPWMLEAERMERECEYERTLLAI